MRIPISIALSLLALYLSGCNGKDDSKSGLDSDASRKNSESASAFASAGRQRNGRSEVFDILNRPGTFTGLEDRKIQQRRMEGLSRAELHSVLKQTSTSRNDKNTETFTLAITELAKRDPKEALAWFSPSEMTGLDASWAFVARIVATSDPVLLKVWFRENFEKANSSVRSDGLIAIVYGLGSVDPAGAFEFSKEMKASSNPDVINGIFESYGKMSPRDAEAAATKSLDGLSLDQALSSIAIGASLSDRSLALEIAGRISDPSLRSSALSRHLCEWVESDVPAAVEKLNQLDARNLQDALRVDALNSSSLVAKLGEKDPDALIYLLRDLLPTGPNSGVFRQAVDSLMSSQPNKAAELIASMPEGKLKEQMVSTQFSQLATADTIVAVQKASGIADDKQRSAAYSSIGSAAGRAGLEKALEIAEGLSGSDKAALLGTAVMETIAQNPEKAADYLAGDGAGTEISHKHELLSRVGESLGASGIDVARNWLDKLPLSDQPAAMTGIASSMAKSDPSGLATFLGVLPKDKNWEAGVRVLIDNLREADTEAAEAWQAMLHSEMEPK